MEQTTKHIEFIKMLLIRFASDEYGKKERVVLTCDGLLGFKDIDTTCSSLMITPYVSLLKTLTIKDVAKEDGPLTCLPTTTSPFLLQPYPLLQLYLVQASPLLWLCPLLRL